MKPVTKTAISIIGLIVLLFLTSCASQKNTASTRWWKSFKARYNTYFNGHQAYLEGMHAKIEGNKDNYTNVIPLLMVGNKTSQNIGSSNFETTIEKCEKTIKLYSIKTKPEAKRGRRMTAEEKAFRNRKEFNPFLKNAWILMGKAQMEKGEFIEAASTFSYTERLYQSQPKIANIARSLLALCYTELEWYYDAEELLQKVRRDSIPHTAKRPYNTAITNWYLRQKQWKEALPYLRQEIKYMPHGIPKARGYFLMGQICQMLNLRKEGYDALQKCMRQSPPYELKFNAQILQTEVMPQGNYQKKISKLKRMAKNPNNKNYLDQIYYAIGNVYLAVPDTTKAIEAYETGSKQPSKNGFSKAVLMLSLGDLYWAKERFDKAQKCYSVAASGLNKDHERYEELTSRNKVLTQLVPPAKEIFVQDSLQALTRMTEKERNAVIDQIIAFVKQKQKSEKRAKSDSLAKTTRNRNRGASNINDTPSPSPSDKSGTWYFYNQQTVMQGEQQFKRIWGERPNEDNWRRSDKAQTQPTANQTDYEKEDSVTAKTDHKTGSKTDKKPKDRQTDSIAEGPLSRSYYLAQLPFTEQQKAESDKKLSQALFKAGIIEKDQLDNYPLSRKTLSRLYFDFADFEQRDELLYQLFLLELRHGAREAAEAYRSELAAKYPDSKFTKLITAPDFEEKAKYGKHAEDSIYAHTYEAYRMGDFTTLEQGCRISETKYPKGDNRAKFIFLHAMTLLHEGDIKGFAQNLRDITKNHADEKISELAGAIIKNIEAGKIPAEGNFDLASLWVARGSAQAAADSTLQKDTLQADPYTDYVAILAYSKDSVNEGQLLYDVSRFNFTSYNIRNFDIEIVQADTHTEMRLKGFTSFDEAHKYQQDLYSDPTCRTILQHVTPLLISEHNLKLIGIKYTLDEYKDFYNKHFVPNKVKEDLKIDQPDNFIWDEFQEVPEKGNDEKQDDIPVEDDGGEWY